VKVAKAVCRAAEREDLNQKKNIAQYDEELEEWIPEQM
jgi:hypothetical protein